MRHHLFIALGLILAAIFAWRVNDALATPGAGVYEFYIAGGFLLSALLIWRGVQLWRQKRRG